MASSVVLLRGINVGSANRLAMPALRAALSEVGLEDARTHLQSGNIVIDTSIGAGELSEMVARLISERFGLEVPVVVRTADELARVVAENPFPRAAELAPKSYQVVFFSAPLAEDVAARVRALSTDPFSDDIESISLAISNEHAYGWHPDGVHRSKLARQLSDSRLGVVATARNWRTVTALLEMTS
jgi:uncharacterized protein (DUF1697 family)